MPGFAIGSQASFVGQAWIGASDSSSSPGTLQPPAIGSATSLFAPRIVRTAKPATLTNAPILQSQRINFVVNAAAYGNVQGFFAGTLRHSIVAGALANAPVFANVRLTLRLSPAAFAGESNFYTAALTQPGAVSAPHRPSNGEIYAPAILFATTTTVTATLNLPGWTPKAPQHRPRRVLATWPNLPKVEAPPWRLMVVTPEVARERARAQIASRKRARELKRRRDVDRRVEAIFNQIVDDEVVRTVVRLVGEEA